MSYPPQTYSGTGEIGAELRQLADLPPLEIGEGSHLRYLATGAMTGGDFGLYHCQFLGPPSGADPHFHRSLWEWFYVEDGTVQLYVGDGWVDGTRGQFLLAGKGRIHGFRNISGKRASMLLGFVPGAPREKFFEGFAELAAGRWRPSRQEFEEFMRQHDNYLVEA